MVSRRQPGRLHGRLGLAGMASPFLDQIVPITAVAGDQHDSVITHSASPPDPAQPDQSFAVSVVPEGECGLTACQHRAEVHVTYPLPVSLVCVTCDAQLLALQVNGDQLLSR